MITTYWRIPNIFTISQEHKRKTTGNGANFPTLHSNKPEQRSEKINVATRRRRRLDPPKSDLGSPGESTVGLPPCSEGAERRGSNVQGFHSSALQQNPAPGSLLRKEDRDLWRYFALGRFPSPTCLLAASSPANFVLGLANAARGRTTRSRPLAGTGARMAFPGFARAEPRAPSGLVSAELRRQSKRSPSPACSAKRRETPASLVMPRPWPGSEI